MSLDTLIRAELARPVEPAAISLADAARQAVGDVRAVLFYGSCLRDRLLQVLDVRFFWVGCVEAAKESGAKLVGLSALLTTTLPAMEETVRAVRQAELAGDDGEGEASREGGHQVALAR